MALCASDTYNTDCTTQDWNSLFTVGSFGFCDGCTAADGETIIDDGWVGVDSAYGLDEFGGSTAGANGSRLSHELFQVPYSEGGGGSQDFWYDGSSAWLGSLAWVIEMDTDNDGVRDAVDTDIDNDGVLNGDDWSILNPFSCQDLDGDGCDDCEQGNDGFLPGDDFDTYNDGPDTNGDGLGDDYDEDEDCDSHDPDIDNDTVLNADDPDDYNVYICGNFDVELGGSVVTPDACDDCTYFGDNGAPDYTDDGPDNDSDHICDTTDTDDDNDSCPDDTDNCLFTWNTDAGDVDPDCSGYSFPTDCGSEWVDGVNIGGCQGDLDEDGMGDACDGDGDGDGYDLDDNCPWNWNPGQDNTDAVDQGSGSPYDGDDEGDACDVCTDSDGDGWGDGGDNGIDPYYDPLQWSGCLPNNGDYDNCPGIYNDLQEDNDGDNEGDACDTDDDNDLDLDVDDLCPMTYNQDQADNDGDGTAGDGFDGTAGVVEDDQEPDEGGDLCDTDDDNDSILDVHPSNPLFDDNCQFSANTDQADYDIDGLGDLCDPCTDLDEDGYPDTETYLVGHDTIGTPIDGCDDAPVDNCEVIYNPDQDDLDGDG
ncbi:MAG: thrombospondin type 3 repeat-containing protein, partial [Deltaproteobacteria bacterium]|nr:thrombospondin type 3 repeat-containing protein [Deltaproteobacteria bacterium]